MELGLKGVMCEAAGTGGFWAVVEMTGLRMERGGKWTVFEVDGEVAELVGKMEEEAGWLAKAVEGKVGQGAKMWGAQQVLKEQGTGKEVSVDVMSGGGAGQAGTRNWTEVKSGEASARLRGEAERDVGRLGEIAGQCREWRSMTGKKKGEEGRIVRRPDWVGYVILGEKKWWWRRRKVEKVDGKWEWRLGEWEAEEKEWVRKRGRPTELTAEERKARKREQEKVWKAGHKKEVAEYSKEQWRRRQEV